MRNIFRSLIVMSFAIVSAACCHNTGSPLSITTEHYPGEIVNYSWSPDDENPEGGTFQVPDNKILVIDTIGIVGNALPPKGWLNGGVRVIDPENSSTSFHFFVTWPWELENEQQLDGTKRVRIYAEPGSRVRLSCTGSTFECRTKFSGYLVPVRN